MKAKTIIILALAIAIVKANRYTTEDRCQPISVPMCKDMPYNQTLFPNLMGNNNQEEAGESITQYHPLIKIKCSADIQLFLCSMYAPLCTPNWPQPIKPCRDLCESAKKGCESLMKQFGYNWPDAFDCSKLPLDGDGEICMQKNTPNIPNESVHKAPSSGQTYPKTPNDGMDFICPAQLKAPQDRDYSLRVYQTTAPDCGAPCYGMFYDKVQINTFLIWNNVFGLVGLLPCLFIIATYLIETQRFPYPQMAIIHMALSWGAVQVLYLIGSLYGGLELPIACGQPFETEPLANLKPERLIRQGTIEYWLCSVIGMALYFFKMAGALWWVMLTLAWFLNTSLRWSAEAMESWSSYMHACVWTLSALLTVLVIVFKKIEGDVLSGVCFVGLWDSGTLLYYVIIPLVVFHAIGIVMLAIGLCSSLRFKEEIRKSGNKTDKFENLITRIGVFSLLYLVPAIIIIACYIHEYIHMDRKMAHWQEKVCRDEESREKWQIPCREAGPLNPYIDTEDQPNMIMDMLKYAAIHVIAALTGVWVFVPKTTDSWIRFYRRSRFGQEQPAQL